MKCPRMNDTDEDPIRVSFKTVEIAPTPIRIPMSFNSTSVLGFKSETTR